MTRTCLIAFFFLTLVFNAMAQESSCSDGVDNDGDGFIDCFDGDCANNAACDGSYIGKDKLCQDPPTEILKFGMKLGATSADRTTLSYGRMAVGDLDRDGTPEMVTTHNNDKKIYILNGDDLSIKRTINTTGAPEYFDHAIANIDDDNCAEIFDVEYETIKENCNSKGKNCDFNSYYFVKSYDCNGALLWQTKAYGQPFTIGLADFDYDGNVELYYKNEILDAKTGEVLVKGSGDWTDYDSGPVAVDILDDSECAECAGLELVLGGEIYAVDLTPRTPGGGSLGTAIKKFNDLPGLGGIVYFPKYVVFGYINSMTSVADYNLDGYLDVVMNGATSKSATSTTTVFFWDVHNNTFKMFQPKQPDGSSWPHGTGRINLADIDGDGKMNATFVSGARIYALKEDFTLLWQKTIQEQTSGFTSTTVFDFNNDNAVEIVYRDETNLYIIDGKTGNAFTTVTCHSRTANDYPIVVDVDADGATEICVSCSTKDNANISDNSNTPFGQIRTYKSSLEPWVSARKVWNQYAYFNVNVNDDLTIPKVQQKHHLVFSTGVCGTGDNRALNSFLNQSAILDSKGCKTYPSADVTFLANPSLLNITPPTCPDKDFKISFSLKNIGDLDLNGNFPITFYNGDPRLAGAVKLSTETIPLSNFKIGDQIDVKDITVTGSGGAFTLFAVLNDNGSTVPTPISLPNSGFDECNFSNNIVSVSVNPKTFSLTTLSTDNLQCGAGSSPPNGTARVFKPEGGVEQTVGYTFYWFDGTTAGAPGSADFTGPVWNGLTNGTYTVYARNDAFQCGSDTAHVTVGLKTRTISATVNVDHAFTNCNSPDGQLSVVPDGGQPLTDFKYEWFEGTVFGTSPTLSNNNVVQSTNALTYSVLVTEISTNCETLESGTVPDLTVTPAVTTGSLPANCAPPNSGQASATVSGVTAGYTFYWYDGSTSKPTEDFLGDTYNNVTAGNYTVIAKDNATGCASNETVVSVPAVSGITVSAAVTAQQTSCTIPNGAASADVGGATAGFTFKWFEGNNTFNQIGTGAEITGLAAGDYTVQATNVVTGCMDTEVITIVDDIKIPTVTLSLTAHQTHCFPVNGAVSAVAAGSPGPYDYYWLNGNIGTPDTTLADFKGGGYSGLAAGFYTVVAVDVNSRCGSARGSIQVLDQTVAPVIASTTSPQTSCDAATPNGQASANVGGSTTGYTFRWFAGADTTNFIAQSPSLSNRAAGTYTVKAANAATGCVATQLVVINDVSAKPTLSLTGEDNTVCSAGIGYTGSVTASFATNPNAQAGQTFVYEWRRNGSVIAGQTGSSLSGVNAGTYEVTVTNQQLRCFSDATSIVVEDSVALPDITTAQAGSTNCDPALPNGEAQVTDVDGSGTGAPYIFQWHTGSDTSTPIAGATSADAVNVQGGTGRNYTVLVTNQDNGCRNTATVLVQDNKALPDLALTPGDNTICDASLTLPNKPFAGSVSAVVTNQVGAIGDYVFTWHDGDDVSDPVNSTSTTKDLVELNGGDYTVTAIHTPTGCESNPFTVHVDNAATLPAITTAQAGSTNCDPAWPNGQAQVTDVDGSGTGAPYIFQWHTGSDTSAPIAGATSANAVNVQGGTGRNYTVLVTNQDNGCQNTATVLVQDNKALPDLALTPGDNTICDASLTLPNKPFAGSVSAVVTNQVGAIGDYVFTWHDGDDVSDPVNSTSTTKDLVELNGGDYTVTAIHTPTGCESNPFTVHVDNAATLPAIATAQAGSTNCDPALPNGQAQVTDVDGSGTGAPYIFQWHTGSDTSTPIVGATSANAVNVQGGTGRNYTVLVTNQDNGCQNTATILVSDASEKPVITLSVTDNTVCDPSLIVPSGPTYNGSVQVATVTYKGAVFSGPGTLSYKWFDGVGTGTPNGSSTTAALSDLDDGSYSATVMINELGCVSDFVTAEVEDDLTLPSVAFSSTASTNCAGGANNGTAAAIATGLAGQTFVYSWHKVNLTGPPVPSADGGNAPTIVRQQGGQNYAVEVTTNETGCVNNGTVQIVDDSRKPVVAPLSFTHNTNCTAPFNGTASANGITPFTYHGTTVSNPYTGFTLTWAGGGTVNAAGDGITALAPGLYSLQVTAGAMNTVTNNNDNCISDPVQVAIIDDLIHPKISTSIVNDQTSCDSGLPNGQLEATETSGAGTYTFDWFQGTGAGAIGAGLPEVVGVDGMTTAALASDDYTVLVANTSTRCETTATVFLPEKIVLPTALLAQTSDVMNCAAPDGQITVTPTLTSAADGDFTIFYLKENTTDATTVKNDADTYTSGDDADLVRSNLGPGYFAVLLRDEITHCESQVVTIQIEDKTDPADISIRSVTTATFCKSGTNGGIDIDVSGGAAPYTFAWHAGGPTNSGPYDYIDDENGTFLPAFDPDAAPFPIATEDISLVPSGFYSVEVIDSRGCGTIFSETVPFQDAPRIAIRKTNSLQCDVANGDGSVSTQIVGSGNYSVNLYLGLNLATATNIASSGVPFGSDGIDNDGDLLIDGADPDFDAGASTLCTDGIDNDGDSAIDSDDNDCDAGLLPLCTNGLDDDGDGFVDRADPDCDGVFNSLNVNTASLDPGDYLVEIVDNSIGCNIYKTAVVKVDALVPVVTLGQVDPNTACDLTQADGRVELTVKKDPLDPRDPVTTPLVYRIDAITPAPLAGAFPMPLSSGSGSVTATLNGFGPQTYEITVTETSSGCSVDRSVTVPNQPAVPDISVAVIDESGCAPITNGSAQVSASMGGPDEYEFTWYDDVSLAPGTVVYQANGTGVGPPGGELLDATKPGYILGAAGQGAGDQTFYVRARRLAGAGAGAGCKSPARQIVIRDTHVTPTATLSSLPNTSCDPLVGEGSISILTVTSSTDGAVAGATYDYSISPDPNSVGTLANQSGALSTPYIDLPEGTYAATALNRVSGCLVQNDITVSPNKYTISLTDTTVNDKLICSPDGDITVTQITIDRAVTSQGPQVFPAAGALAANFEFRWFKGTPGTFTSGTPLQDDAGPAMIDGEVLTIGSGAGQYNDPAPARGAGTYYVVARQLPGAGRSGANCESVPLMVEIKDKSVDPVIALTPFSNTSCDPATFEGEIEVDVTDGSVVSPVPGPAFGYTYAWTALTAGRAAPNPAGNPYDGNSNVFTQVEDGVYELRATNTTTGCVSTRQTTIQQNTTPIFVEDIVSEAQLFCTPSGSLEVSGISYNDRTGATTNVSGAGLADFTFRWFRDGTAPGNVVGGTTAVLDSAAGNYPGIGADPDYYVVATRMSNAPGLNCSSAPFRVEIKDERKYPVIALTPFSNTSCDPAAFEGEIEVDVTDGSVVSPVPAFGYTYAWSALTAGRAAPNPSGNPYDGNSNVFTQIQDGVYELRATNTTTGCVSTRQTTIQQNTTPIFVEDIVSEAQLFCTPSGSLEVSGISYNDRTGATTNVSGAGLADFTLQWFRDGTAPGNVVGGATAVLDSAAGNYPGIGADPDYYVVATRMSNAPGLNCSSAPFRVEIKDERKYPAITLTPFSNTSCDPATFEGEIEVDVTDGSVVSPVPGPAFGYTYAWTALTAGRAAPNPAGNPYDGNSNVFTQVEDGVYELRATNTTTGCVSTRQTTIQQNTTPIFVEDIVSEAQLFCTPSGSLEVSGISYNDRTGATTNVSGAGLADFTFQWFKDGTAPGNVVGGTTAVLDSAAGNYPGIGADPDYYVVATRMSNAPGLNCSSAPFRIGIPDERHDPVVKFNTTANTTCNNNFDASITLFAETDGVGAAANYSIVWKGNPGPPVSIANMASTGSPYTTAASDNIGVGTYTATVTNLVTQCFTTASVTVLQNTTQVQIWNATKVDQTDCAPPNGSITIDTNDPADVSVVGAYTFAWDKGGVPLTPVPDNILAGVEGGVYTVTGTKTSGIGAGCTTAPFIITLKNLTENPAVELSSQANFACDPTQANGQVASTVFEGSATPPATDYGYAWFAGKNTTTGPVIGNAPTLLKQVQGDYTLEVVDNVSPNRGCTNTGTKAIGFDKTTFAVAMAKTDQNLCAPLQNGGLSVTGITEVRTSSSATTTNFALFDFQWFDGNGAPHASTPSFVTGANAINNVLAGTYAVHVRNALGCTSTKTAGIVDDLTVLPAITLENYLNPAVCILPETPGFLQVSADNSLNFSDYTFEWFEGPDTSGPLVEANNATLDSVVYSQPLQYTVRVTNIATSCVNVDTYRFKVDTVDVQVLASAVARTNCLVDNGSLFATTLNGAGVLYNYEWYSGPAVSGTPVYTTKDVQGVPTGQYTVVAVNPGHAFCTSKPFTTLVSDARVLPPVEAVQRNPLTYCDASNPNGVAFATVGGEVTGYTFQWFEGSATGAPFYSGSEVAGLAATTYQVRATDVITGCAGTTSIQIENDPVKVPVPAVVVVSHLTNCVVPDGILSASVHGNTAGYLLQWYDGQSVKNKIDAMGEFYRDLDKGFYTTTATDNESGCVSDPVVTEVLPFQETPDFEIATEPTNCEQNIGEARLVPLNNVPIFTVEWDINGAAEFGTMLSGLPKGEFAVTATSYKQCVTTKTFEIQPEVLVFNGISRNNDGQNDIFEIACIQDFPGNNVKIFDRAGTLVYEGNGYDNQDVFFDGVSNRGINLLGRDLPDGTYFYIIDKRDGSEPRTGYLELLSN